MPARTAIASGKGPISGTWFLVDEVPGELALSDRGTTAFSVERAIAFLKALRDDR